jgi:hypothetical protein
MYPPISPQLIMMLSCEVAQRRASPVHSKAARVKKPRVRLAVQAKQPVVTAKQVKAKTAVAVRAKKPRVRLAVQAKQVKAKTAVAVRAKKRIFSARHHL